CLYLAMDVFDFHDLYNNLIYKPFIEFTNDAGASTFRVSVNSILLLVSLFFVFRYLNKAIHSLWQQNRYNQFLKKTKRETIHKDEINLSLGNSIINFLIWTIYAIIIIVTLHILTGSLSIIAGGFSAGVGLALKDILNNFIYGIQLMSGRLRVGDYIECDGIRGKVESISYQTTTIQTMDGALMAFTNSTLFNENFKNLTKNNSYELVVIPVGVAYGSDVNVVREKLTEALKSLYRKDHYGREVIDRKRGITVAFSDFGDSSVDLVVKQYVLVEERIPYIAAAKELIYNTLNENGIEIPFPQRDVYIKQNVK
ncbi:MAG: mechanosensitive ion channel family protein, partial [Bacteroidales bacterium]|nr:mechanosensitive ion channel family protein [Bacteroidales bacterium]